MNLVLIGSLTACSLLLFTLAWAYAKKIDNYSIVDALWSLSFAIFALPIAVFSEGFLLRRLLFAGMFAFWSLRLGSFLTRRIFSHLDREDKRYLKLRADYGSKVESRFLLFFLYQALSVIVLLAPLFVASENRDAEIGVLEKLGLFFWIIGVSGEALADAQKAKFYKNPANHGGVCEDGLWNYSRHPNYFFEAVIWLGYGVFALGSAGGWATLYAPALIWYLLLKVTGVPYSEEASLAAKGDLYRRYQKTTSVFIPLPKKR